MEVKQFNIEQEFQKYCQRSKLDLDNCSTAQVIETRRAFYGAIGQFLFYLKTDLAEVSEEEGVAELEGIWRQIAQFWERQAGRYSGGVINKIGE